METLKVYRVDETGAYAGEVILGEADRDEDGNWLFPNDCVDSEPPPFVDGQIRVFMNGAWSYLPTPALSALIPAHTPDYRSMAVRARRDRELAETDWIVTRSLERGEPVPAEWAAYRQALRDIPQQPGYPMLVQWPSRPALGAH